MEEENVGDPQTITRIGTAFNKKPKKEKNSSAKENNKEEKEKEEPIWQQEAKDEKGRKRFHGAFTGGFTAGFFNTVGTKEGWQPSQFKSSRSSKRNFKKQEITDFLDEEDKQEGIFSKLVKTTQTFDENANKEDGTLFSSVFKIIEPNSVSIGEKLLQKLSNLKMEENETKVEPPKKLYGPQLSREEIDSLRNLGKKREKEKNVVHYKEYKMKNDFFGLGFDPYSNAPEFQKVNHQKNESNNKKLGEKIPSIFKIADNENDIYNDSDFSNYDISLNVNEDENESFEDKKVSFKKNKQQKNKVRDSFGDSTSKIRNFVPSSSKYENSFAEFMENSFNSVKIPQNFTEKHVFPFPLQLPSNLRRNLGEKTAKFQSSQSTAYERASILGEKMSIATPSLSSLPINPSLPFSDNFQKQQRYRQFLLSQAQNVNISFQFENEQEKSEFENAKSAWKAIPDVMTSRFVPESKPGELEAKKLQEQKIQEEAFKMYGKNTRKEEDWVPSKLLCKRMNVADPWRGKELPTIKNKEISSGFPQLDLFFSSFQATNLDKNVDTVNRESEESESEDDDEKVEKIAEIEKPSVDIFKAIFENPQQDNNPSPTFNSPSSIQENQVKKEEKKSFTETNFNNEKEFPQNDKISLVKQQTEDLFSSIFGAPKSKDQFIPILQENEEENDSHLWVEKTNDKKKKKKKHKKRSRSPSVSKKKKKKHKK